MMNREDCLGCYGRGGGSGVTKSHWLDGVVISHVL
jgi:hypothetical protein